MPLLAPKLKQDLELAITNSLTKEFSKEGPADPSAHKRMAAAIAEAVSQVLVKALTTEAEVLPGIPTAGSPAAQTSVGPGKIG